MEGGASGNLMIATAECEERRKTIMMRRTEINDKALLEKLW